MKPLYFDNEKRTEREGKYIFSTRSFHDAVIVCAL